MALMMSGMRTFARRGFPARGVKLPMSAVFMNEGEQALVQGPKGDILVSKVDGKLYAVDATCPHLSFSMLHGEIVKGSDGPNLVCPYHDSTFNMKTGKCVQWCEGIPSWFGGSKADISAYKVIASADGGCELETAE